MTDEQGAIELFGDGDAAAGVGSRSEAAGDLDPAVGEGDGVVVGDDARVMAGEVAV